MAANSHYFLGCQILFLNRVTISKKQPNKPNKQSPLLSRLMSLSPGQAPCSLLAHPSRHPVAPFHCAGFLYQGEHIAGQTMLTQS